MFYRGIKPVQDDWLALFEWSKRNRDLPDGELVSIDIAEVVGLLVLDCNLR